MKEISEKLKQGVTQEHASSKRHFEQYVNSLRKKITKLEEEEVLAREVIESNSFLEMRQYSENSGLVTDIVSEDSPEDLETWMAPNLLFKSNLVSDKEVEQYLNPIMGSLCTIQKESTITQGGNGVHPRFETDMFKRVFPFARQKGTKAIHIVRSFQWESPNSFSGKTTIFFFLLDRHRIR